MRSPPEVPKILIDASLPERPPRRAAEAGNYHRGMTHHRNHRIALVYPALRDAARWMCMDIGNHHQRILPTIFPQRCVSHGVKRNGPTLACRWIKVVVTHERRNDLGRSAGAT